MDMLSRLPLAHMYRAARLAGVPLKLELVTQQLVKDGFKIAPETIAQFNHYLTYAKTTSGSLTDIMREQRKFYIQWRYKCRQLGPTPIDSTRSYQDARPQDRSDVFSANGEFTKEIEEFERWRKNFLNPSPMDEHTSAWPPRPRKPEEIQAQNPGFGNDRYREWEEIARFWGKEFLPEGMETFFDDYVHDSRAWFKLEGPEADEVEGVLQTWLRQIKEYEDGKHDPENRAPLSLSPKQKEWALRYEQTGKVPEMLNSGREPLWSGAGHLRYRKVYAGADNLLISQHEPHFEKRGLASTSPADKAKAA